MDHQEALEILELAAVEPSGFERLAAGDTPEAGALAGHLAGCASCTAVFESLGRTSATIRGTVREMPPADLRERTLAFVAATGRIPAAVEVSAPSTGPAPTADETGPVSVVASAPRRSSIRRAGWWAPLATAAVLVAAVGLGGWWTARSALEDEQTVTTELAAVTEASLYVQAQPDARIVALAATEPSSTASGAMSYSATGKELVVVADGLAEPPAGSEYHCWVEISGVRDVIGPMHLGGGKAYWAGWSESAGRLVVGARFGVTLGPDTGSDPGTDVLAAEL